MSGAKVAPYWTAQLEFAKDMFTPAWEIFGGRKILWWCRWKAIKDETTKVYEAERISRETNNNG